MKWQSDWEINSWDRKTHVTTRPSYVLSEQLIGRIDRYYGKMEFAGLDREPSKVGYMPAAPMVDSYRFYARRSDPGEYGFDRLKLNVEVKWKPELREFISKRDELLGDRRVHIDRYHSQLAISGGWLLLNELQRKTEKSRLTDTLVQKYRDAVDTTVLDDFQMELFEFILKRFKFSHSKLGSYIGDHETSTVIPGKRGVYQSKKWTQLNIEEFRDLFELNKAFIERILAEFDNYRYRIHNPFEIGRGIRARSEKFKDYSPSYDYTVERARQVGFAPYLSSWFAFLDDKDKEELWFKVKKFGEELLGCEVLLAPLLKGHYWKKIMDKLYEGFKLWNSDGSNWESMTARILDFYLFAVDDGIYQYMSGTAMTSIHATLALLFLTHALVVLTGAKTPEAVGALGDDRIVIGKHFPRDFVHVPDVLELDTVGTNDNVILGLCLLPHDGEYYATYPGTIRISVDRGHKVRSWPELEWSDPIGNSMDEQSFAVYYEMATEGTINNIPMVELISDYDEPDFWYRYSDDRYTFLGEIANEARNTRRQGRREVYDRDEYDSVVRRIRQDRFS